MKNLLMNSSKSPNIRAVDSSFFDNQINSPWMDTIEVAKYLKTTVSHIRLLVFRRIIPVSKAGRLNRFNKGEIDRWLLTKKGG